MYLDTHSLSLSIHVRLRTYAILLEDLGGTTIAAGLVGEDGKLVTKLPHRPCFAQGVSHGIRLVQDTWVGSWKHADTNSTSTAPQPDYFQRCPELSTPDRTGTLHVSSTSGIKDTLSFLKKACVVSVAIWG